MKRFLLLTLILFICIHSNSQSTKVFSDDFSDNRNKWDVGVEEFETSLIKDGKYQIKITDKKSWHWFDNKFKFSSYSNFKLETLITQTNRYTDNDLVGVIFASTENLAQHYIFLFDTKVGSYKILKIIDTRITILKDWTSADSVGKKLKVEILKNSNYYSFYLNDNFLTIQKIDEEFGDRFGFYAGPSTECEIDYVTIESKLSNLSNLKISGSSYINLNNALWLRQKN